MVKVEQHSSTRLFFLFYRSIFYSRTLSFPGWLPKEVTMIVWFDGSFVISSKLLLFIWNHQLPVQSDNFEAISTILLRNIGRKSKSWGGNSDRRRSESATRGGKTRTRAFCERKSIGTWAANSPSLVSSSACLQGAENGPNELPRVRMRKESRGGETEERTLFPVRSARRRSRRPRDHFNTR